MKILILNFFFEIKESKITRGHNFTLVKKQSRLDVRKFSFSQRTINVWNNLSEECVEEGGHVCIAKVQHTLAKAVHALGCLYLVIIMSNYSRFIMPVKKLQFPS